MNNSANETVQQGLAAFARATEERDFYKSETERLTVSVARLEGENETLRSQTDKLNRQLSNALAHTAELKTHMNNGIDLFRRALERSQSSAPFNGADGSEEPVRIPAKDPTSEAMGLAAIASEAEKNGAGMTLHRDIRPRIEDRRSEERYQSEENEA
jgi:hypothetical protein